MGWNNTQLIARQQNVTPKVDALVQGTDPHGDPLLTTSSKTREGFAWSRTLARRTQTRVPSSLLGASVLETKSREV